MLNIKRFRRVQTTISIAIFILIFLFCWKTTKFNLEEIQLSYWGIDEKIAWFWNSCIVLLSVSIYYNTYNFIQSHPRMQFKTLLQGIFLMVSVFLALTGLVNMNYPLHNITAYLYFFLYPLSVFCVAHLNRKHLQYKEWLTHLIFSIAMVVSPLLFIHFFEGMAISETAHTIIVMIWNLWILLDD